MITKIVIPLTGLIAGLILGVYCINPHIKAPIHIKSIPKQVIGFLPYWLLDRAHTDYSSYITTLTYFGLRMDGNGHIMKLATPQQEDPGWYDLSSGKLNPFFANARQNNVKLSLLIDSGDSSTINQLLSKPAPHAVTLVHDAMPIMKKYHFQDLNLDIEYTATPSAIAQTHFTQFIHTVKQQLTKYRLGTLTLEISPIDVVTSTLINPKAIAPYADTVILMAYDYHSPTSLVTGPIAPLQGAGKDLEYDVTTAVIKSLQSIPAAKLILGIPLYGYEWETLNTAVRSAIIPGTGELASNARMDSFLAQCATCSAFFDNESQEEFLVYHDQKTGTYHQAFFPTAKSTEAKINLANKVQLGGIALWALGYEGANILNPLTQYKN